MKQLLNGRLRLMLAAILSLIIGSPSIQAQLSITGPKCVVPGTEYTYKIKGDWKQGAVLKVCITGGVLLSPQNACQNGKPVATVTVKWNATATTGAMNLESSIGNTALSCSITQLLSGGTIASGKKEQDVTSKTTPATILCSPANGGSCTPIYKYQWERSKDRFVWESIVGATSLNLSFNTPLKRTAFFRRKTTVTSANNIAYSDIAAIYVIPEEDK